MKAICFLMVSLLVLTLGLSSCVMERTVTDGSGTVIYQEPEIHTPFESDEKRLEEVEEKKRSLGW